MTDYVIFLWCCGYSGYGQIGGLHFVFYTTLQPAEHYTFKHLETFFLVDTHSGLAGIELYSFNAFASAVVKYCIKNH